MTCQSVCASSNATRTSRRSFIALAGAAALPGSFSSATPALAAASAEDERFMLMAIEEARQGDFPFGTVIVRDGAILARGRNLGRTNDDPTAHGEMVAIRRALAEHGSASLRDATLYTSGEPCPMCMGAILWCSLRRVVFAASIAELATRLDQIMVTSTEMRARATFAALSVTGGVLAREAMQLFDK